VPPLALKPGMQCNAPVVRLFSLRSLERLGRSIWRCLMKDDKTCNQEIRHGSEPRKTIPRRARREQAKTSARSAMAAES
jgi:hypothetical protein